MTMRIANPVIRTPSLSRSQEPTMPESIRTSRDGRRSHRAIRALLALACASLPALAQAQAANPATGPAAETTTTTTPPAPARPTFAPLRWAFSPEQLLRYTLEFQVQRTRPGSVIDQTERYHIDLRVLSVDDAGTARIRATFDRVEFRLLLNGSIAAETDTNKNAEPSAMGFDARITEFRGFAGRSISATITAQGVVSDVQDADTLRKAILALLGDRPPADSVARVTRNTEPGTLADMLSVITRLAVPSAQSIGQTAPPWDYSLSKFEVTPDPASPAVVRSVSMTDAGPEVISQWQTGFLPSPDAAPDAPSFEIGSLSGRQVVAVDRGIVRSLESSATLEFTTQVPAPPVKPPAPGSPASQNPPMASIKEVMRSTSRVTLVDTPAAPAPAPVPGAAPAAKP
jgi:hypothetical protein